MNFASVPLSLELLERGIKNPTKVPAYILRQVDQPPFIKNDQIYKIYLLSKGASPNPEQPDISEYGTDLKLKTLQTKSEYQAAAKEVRSLGLHPHFHTIKNWDALLALKRVLHNTGHRASVLDAGGETYSPLVEWLYLYGYSDLCVCNIDFGRDFYRGPVAYRNADFTASKFQTNSFDVVTALSVIEHGLNLQSALEEFYRILKPGGVLVVSTDYWPNKISTENKHTEYGDGTQDWNIFDKSEMNSILEKADDIGFETPDIRNLSANEKTIQWKNRTYTFVYFELSTS